MTLAPDNSRAGWQRTGAPLRATAARIVSDVLERGVSLTRAFDEEARATIDARFHGFCQELVYGTLRWCPRLQWYAAQLIKRPLPDAARDIHALVLLGLYQLDVLGTPEHVAVSSTVEACRCLHKPWACALVNGVLRNFLRARERLRREVHEIPAACHAHPQWLTEIVGRAWPDDWQEILTANNAHPPMTLRVNRLRTSRDRYLHSLHEHGIEAVAASFAPEAIRLVEPVSVDALPGFRDGLVSVQDEAAQLAAPLLDLQPGQRVLDACAAPGGKSAHILEAQPSLSGLVAVDNDAVRARSLKETLSRLQLSATVVTGDALDPRHWFDGRPFDRILCDAPCSATGVIRRHPDIKCLRRAADIPQFACTQRQLLEALWPLLAVGGKLLYATCSILPEENVSPVQDFLGAHEDAAHVTLKVPWGRPMGIGRQVLPGEGNMDGFFYALLVKR